MTLQVARAALMAPYAAAPALGSAGTCRSASSGLIDAEYSAVDAAV